MENTDFELINRTISGDQDAFSTLVRKYQKRVHALAWRKTGDFHVAEEITQDTFLRAYRKLGALKNPNLFAGWLYVIANRLCNTWFKKREQDMQSLETVPIVELEEHLYSEYTTNQREERASEKRINLVKRLLQKLPESERIVMTLHYLAGSSCKEISEFLGVSLNTVKSRLHRARQRLQKEDHMVRETLGSFQPSTNLTENIIRTLKETGAQIDPAAPSGNKPLVPWAIAASTLILVTLMLGLGTQHLARFQQPYSLDATSEMIVDIVDAAVISNLPSDPDVRNQIGNVDAPDKSVGTSQHPDSKSSHSASGRVLDEEGNPVNNVKIAILPVKNNGGGWFPIQIDEDSNRIDLSQYQAETDAAGRFMVTNIRQGPVLLHLFPMRWSGIRISKVQIAGMFFYASSIADNHGIVFAMDPDKDVENIEVVLKQPQIRLKAQRGDDTPIANAIISYTIELEGSSCGEMRRIAETDDEGHFVYYLDEYPFEITTGTFSMSATYQKQTVNVKPIVFKHIGQTYNVVLTFGDSQETSSGLHSKGLASDLSSTNTSIDSGDPSESPTQKRTSTLSGRVVDVQGNLVENLHVFIGPIAESNLLRKPLWFPDNLSNMRRTLTDFDGYFSITNIPAGAKYFDSLQLQDNIKSFFPNAIEENIKEVNEEKDNAAFRTSGIHGLKQIHITSDYDVLSLRTKGITIHARNGKPITFALKPGTHIENVVIKVKPRMRIRGRVLWKDSTPVANTRIRLRISRDTEDGKEFGGFSFGNPRTDANGYFVYYLKEEDDSTFYTFSVIYMGLIANADPVLLTPGERLEGLKFMFHRNPITPKPPPYEVETGTK